MIKIDGYPIDAALAEAHEREAEITKFPIEDGSPISDHVRINPATVRIQGVVSNTPVGALADIRTADDAFRPTDEALAKLEKIFTDRNAVTIETSIKKYPNMIMQSLEFPQGGDTGDCLPFSATFTEVIIEQNVRRAIKIAVQYQQVDRGKLGSNALTRMKQGFMGIVDKNGRELRRVDVNGVDKYYLPDGSEVPPLEAAAVARENNAVLTKMGPNGYPIPVDSQDYQPYTPKQKKPFWAPERHNFK